MEVLVDRLAKAKAGSLVELASLQGVSIKRIWLAACSSAGIPLCSLPKALAERGHINARLGSQQ